MSQETQKNQPQQDLPKPHLNKFKIINGYKIPSSSLKLSTIRQESHYSQQQLKQQRNILHNQLIEITKIINELQQFQQQTKQKIQKSNELTVIQMNQQEIQNKQLLKQLTKQFQDYQFMMTGSYSIKIRQQLSTVKSKITSTKKQLNKLNIQLSKPYVVDQIDQKYQIEIKKLQRQIQQIAYHNKTKQDKLNKILNQISNKSKATLALQKKISHFQDQTTSQTVNKQIKQQYYSTLEKKQKTQKLYEAMQKRKIIQFNAKARQIDNLIAAGQQIQETIQSIISDIHTKKQQLFALKKTQKQKNMKKLYKQQQKTKQSRRKRIYTELESHNYFSANNIEAPEYKLPYSIKTQIEQSELDNTIVKPRIKIKSRNNTLIQQKPFLPTLQKHLKEIASINRATEIKKSQSQAPSFRRSKKSYETLLKMVNKPKLQLQEQYDINDLLYQ